MTDASQPDKTDVPAHTTDHERLAKLRTFAREHPRLSVLGAAGVGLFGGVELAAGILLGAAVAAIVRSRTGTTAEREAMRDRARSLLDRAPHQVRERARAVVQAARGKIAPVDEHERAPESREPPITEPPF